MAAMGYAVNIQYVDIMGAILAGVVEAGDVIGTDGPGRTVLAATVDDWLSDERHGGGADEPRDGDVHG
jgi:hypothetical protein